jgi:hypothetical protein
MENSYCQSAFELGFFSPTFGLKLKYELLFGLEAASLQTGLNTISFSDSSACRFLLKILGIVNLLCCVGQYLIFIYMIYNIKYNYI